MPEKKDAVDLICSVSELVGLFEKSTGLNDFLQGVVSTVAYHMNAAVCSIYLYDEGRQQLVLTANQGLNQEHVGTLSMNLGEGITGMSLKEMRPIRVARGSDHPHYRFIPGINEEHFEAFLAVPILQGLNRVGILVVQDPKSDYFDANDTRALQAIAAQLANTIENARLILSIYESQDIPKEEAPHGPMPMVFRGKPAAPGFADGKATVLGVPAADYLRSRAAQMEGHTREDFEYALTATEQQLKALQEDLEESLTDVASLIFSAHLLMLADSSFSGAMRMRMDEGLHPAEAVASVVDHYISLFSKSENQKLQEKVLDLKDLGHRLLHNMERQSTHASEYEGEVLIGREMLPSDILRFVAQGAEGLILTEGSTSSHVAILARSLHIPMIITEDRRVLDLKQGERLLMDAIQGTVYVNPGSEVVEAYNEFKASRQRAEEAHHEVHDKTYTRDGVRITLLANINLLSDLEPARQLKAEGIGLYRSEFPFIVRNDFPSEEEQVRIYHRLVEGMPDRPVRMRTLDVGGDKMLSYFPRVEENNPFLGLRAIRFSLKNRGLFSEQLRAMLRAGHGHDIGIMFPLVSSVDDFLEAREVVQNCLEELAQQGVAHAENPKLGVMIELPSVVEVVEEMAQEVDFLSIGSNDLVQYTLAVDRTNLEISDLFVFHHPAVLRSLARIVRAAVQHKKPISICGDMVQDEKMIPFLIGIGLRSFSADPYDLVGLQDTIENIQVDEAENMASTLLAKSRISEVNKYLDAYA